MRPWFILKSIFINYFFKFSHLSIRPFLSNEISLPVKYTCMYISIHWQNTNAYSTVDRLTMNSDFPLSMILVWIRKQNLISISNWLINQDMNSFPLYKPTLQQNNNHNPILKYVLVNVDQYVLKPSLSLVYALTSI